MRAPETVGAGIGLRPLVKFLKPEYMQALPNFQLMLCNISSVSLKKEVITRWMLNTEKIEDRLLHFRMSALQGFESM